MYEKWESLSRFNSALSSAQSALDIGTSETYDLSCSPDEWIHTFSDCQSENTLEHHLRAKNDVDASSIGNRIILELLLCASLMQPFDLVYLLNIGLFKLSG